VCWFDTHGVVVAVSLAAVKKQISEEEHEKAIRGEPDCRSGDTSPSDFLVAGMTLQDDQ
jgi:hypothetical protein